MKLKTSFFNCGLLKSNLKRFWPLFTAYFIVLLLAIPMSVGQFDFGSAGCRIIYRLESYLDFSSVIITFIMAITTAMGVYGFMYNQRTCGMIASLPLKRKTIFATAALSGIMPVIVINIIIGLLTAIPLFSDNEPLAVETLLIWFAVTSMQYIFFFGMASIIAVITGSMVVLPVFYVLFSFLAVGLEAAVREVFAEFIFGFTNTVSEMTTAFLSPLPYLLELDGLVVSSPNGIAAITDVYYPSWHTVVGYAAVGAAFLVAAMLIFRKRRMENCGDIIAVPPLRPVFKYGVAICAALANGILLRGIFGISDIASLDAAMYVAYMVIGAFIGYFGSEMLLRKSFRVFKGNWLGYFILALLCGAFIWSCLTDYAGLGSRTPDNKEVAYVTISTSGGTALKLEEPSSVNAVLEFNGSIIENKQQHIDAAPESCVPVTIEYRLASGRILTREYELSRDSEDFESYKEILSCGEAAEYYVTPGVPINAEHVAYSSFTYYDSSSGEWNYIDFTPVQAVDFFRNGYSRDIESNNLNYYDDTSEFYEYVEIQFTVIDKAAGDRDENLYFRCYINPECDYSIQWIMDNLGIDLAALFEQK